MYCTSTFRTVTKLWKMRRMECRIMFRVFTVMFELYLYSSELVRNILMIPNMVTPVLTNVKISHKIGEIVFQEPVDHY